MTEHAEHDLVSPGSVVMIPNSSRIMREMAKSACQVIPCQAAADAVMSKGTSKHKRILPLA